MGRSGATASRPEDRVAERGGVALTVGGPGDLIEALGGFSAARRVLGGKPAIRLRGRAEITHVQRGGAELGPHPTRRVPRWWPPGIA